MCLFNVRRQLFERNYFPLFVDYFLRSLGIFFLPNFLRCLVHCPLLKEKVVRWLIDWLIDWLVGWLIDWVFALLMRVLIHWLADTSWLTYPWHTALLYWIHTHSVRCNLNALVLATPHPHWYWPMARSINKIKLQTSSYTRSVTHSVTHSLTHSLSHTHSLIISLTHSLTDSFTHSLTHSLLSTSLCVTAKSCGCSYIRCCVWLHPLLCVTTSVVVCD